RVPAPPAAPDRMVEHCTAVAGGAAPGRVQYGNGLGHLKGGDEMWEGDQTASPPRPAPGQDDVIFAGPAYDTILDYGGDNCLHGEEGADWIHGGSGTDLVDGANGADTLYGGSGDDFVDGDDLTAPIPEPGQPGGPPAGQPPTNVDLLDGGPGDDVLIGGFGVDEMYGGTGNDLCIGSAGGDGVDLPEPDATDEQRMQDYPWVPTGHDPDGNETGKWLNKFHWCETIWTKATAPDGLEALLVVDGTQPPESAPDAARPGDNPCSVSPWARWQLASADASTACPGDWPASRAQQASFWPPAWSPGPVLSADEERQEDAREASALRGDLQPAAHQPLVEQALARVAEFSTADYPACGPPTILGGNGDDYLASNAATSDRMYGSNGNDRLDGFGGGNCLDGGAGEDVFFGGKGQDVLYGGPGDNHFYGGAANDVVYGGPGDDWIYGGTGDDVIDGGGGVNHCFGQSGHDVFINCQYVVSGLDEQTGNWGNIARY
ncbi:MAG TPA: calcium-binding protein, partial [Actinopolymorphaceae bacterium]|nr:calcium-binding protein [Actinopolymorphaceae bacterium]